MKFRWELSPSHKQQRMVVDVLQSYRQISKMRTTAMVAATMRKYSVTHLVRQLALSYTFCNLHVFLSIRFSLNFQFIYVRRIVFFSPFSLVFHSHSAGGLFFVRRMRKRVETLGIWHMKCESKNANETIDMN